MRAFTATWYMMSKVHPAMLFLLPSMLTAAVAAPPLPSQEATTPAVWYVDSASTPPGSGTLADPFFSVSFAVANPSVVAGDTILVEPGVYRGEQIDFAGKDLEVRSTAGPALTRLIAPPQLFPFEPHPVVQVQSGETGVILEGFTLSGGTGTFSFPCGGFTERVGGAMVICGSAARVENCVFEGNDSERGGSMYVRNGSLTLVDSTFSGPGSPAIGQALYVKSAAARIEGCTFQDFRIAPMGTPIGHGAVIIDQSTAQVSDCTFQRNSTRLFGAHLWSRSSDVVVEDCSFGESTGFAGASLAAFGGQFTLRRSVVRDGRSVSAPGAGLFAAGGDVIIERCLFRSNEVRGLREGGAISLQNCNLTVRTSRFHGNRALRGGAIDVDLGSSATVEDSNFMGNVADENGGAIAVGDGQLSATRVVFQGNSAGGGFRGGAVVGRSRLVRCTLRGNAAGTGGGASGPVDLTGSIAWDNTPSDLDAGCTAEDSIVGRPDGATLTQVSQLPPRFFGRVDVHLLPGSPAIDALDSALGLDADGSAQEFGARTFLPGYCGDLCGQSESEPGCPSGPNSTLQTAQLFAIGSSDIARDRLILAGRGFPAQRPALLLASESSGMVSLPGCAQPLCLGAPIYRLMQTATMTRPDGTFSAVFPTLDGPLAGSLMVGQLWHIQSWFRDVVLPFHAEESITSCTSSSIVVILR